MYNHRTDFLKFKINIRCGTFSCLVYSFSLSSILLRSVRGYCGREAGTAVSDSWCTIDSTWGVCLALPVCRAGSCRCSVFELWPQWHVLEYLSTSKKGMRLRCGRNKPHSIQMWPCIVKIEQFIILFCLIDIPLNLKSFEQKIHRSLCRNDCTSFVLRKCLKVQTIMGCTLSTLKQRSLILVFRIFAKQANSHSDFSCSHRHWNADFFCSL